MATVLDLIKASLRAIRVIDADETPSASDSATALFALNSILGRLSAQTNAIYQDTEISHVLTPGDAEYTVGTSGNIAYEITRVEQAFIRQNNTDLEMQIWSESDYQSIPDKTSGGTPSVLNYERGSKVRLWPVPSQADTLRLIALVPFAEVSLATTVTYPAEYRDFIVLSVAKRIAPEYGVGLWNVELQDEYAAAERTVKSMNLSQTLSQAQFDIPCRRTSDVWFVKRNFPS
jgi:hypothetical protein